MIIFHKGVCNEYCYANEYAFIDDYYDSSSYRSYSSGYSYQPVRSRQIDDINKNARIRDGG